MPNPMDDFSMRQVLRFRGSICLLNKFKVAARNRDRLEVQIVILVSVLLVEIGDFHAKMYPDARRIGFLLFRGHLICSRKAQYPLAYIRRQQRALAWLLRQCTCKHTESRSVGKRRISIHQCIRQYTRLCTTAMHLDNWRARGFHGHS